MTIDQYLQTINERYQTGRSTEHSYRGDLQTLLESLLPSRNITNEPTRSKVGAPDYIITNKKIPVGFIEAKDIGDPDLKGKKKNKEQFNRYKATRDPFIFTDYLRFLFYDDEELRADIRIADIEDGNIVPRSSNFDEFRDLCTDFATQSGQTIRSASTLSKMMAGKARLLATIIENALNSDEEASSQVNESANTTLREQLEAFQNVLIHDIDAKEFGDIYAQTIAYGMFAARLNDTSLDTFSRHEAAELIPKTNPFLRKLFQYIAGYDLDDRLTWIVDALADIFRATDVAALLDDFGAATQQNDPIIHFYETFLAEFDPALRKSRGVWYTPEPVVNFIVRAVDDILKDEFDLKDGLADTAKTTVKVNTDVKDKRSPTGYKQEEKEVHKVQILDPAAGTGTFLAEAIKQIRAQFDGQEGLWPNYVEEHLIPRLNGFELLMASYAMAHLKLDMLLRETGYNREAGQRFRVYLTNSLEEHHPDTGTLFAGWLSHEANEANHVKRDSPVMVVMGNPPYAGESSNKGDWIMELMKDYKKEPGGKKKLQEKNSKFINDDYVKFIRYGQQFVDKNGEGILAFINNHGFLDNPTFRGMRWHLLNSFDKIYVLDLHGNLKKKETTPDGNKDENVFDIEPGVSINIMLKTKKDSSDGLADVYHTDLYGKRNKKYKFLLKNDFRKIEYQKIKPQEPFYFLTNKDFSFIDKYNEGFHLKEIFLQDSLGVLSKNDSITISISKSDLEKIISDFSNLDENNLRRKHSIKKDSRDWILSKAIDDVKKNHSTDNYKYISYRPFDMRWTYFTGESKGFFAYSQKRIMSNLKDGNNFALISGRQGQAVGPMQWNLSFITNTISDQNIFRRGGGSVFPLYLYPEDDSQQTLDGRPERKPNLDPEIVQEIADGLGLKFVPEPNYTKASTDEPTPLSKAEHPSQEGNSPGLQSERKPDSGRDEVEDKEILKQVQDDKVAFAAIDLLDYIYAVLHSPSYREKYKEFLKIDFPRVPYPSDAETFWQLVALGGELRQIHLLEHPVVEEFITTYPEAGSNEITKRLTKTQPGFIPYEDSVIASETKQSPNMDKEEIATSPDSSRNPRDDNQVVGKVWINKTQYFGNVPEKAWNFYIGGYQPAEKWLKDRRDRTLSVEEIQHYQKIIVALMETDRIMQQIDEIVID